jgi:hypothetical protein
MPRFVRRGPAREVVDEDTGIEVIEKNWKARVRTWEMSGEDMLPTITFIFRDPRCEESDRPTEIEFETKRLWQRYELVGRFFAAEGWYGLEIDSRQFESRFRRYAGGNAEKLAELRPYITDALLLHLHFRKDRVVRFT